MRRIAVLSLSMLLTVAAVARANNITVVVPDKTLVAGQANQTLDVTVFSTAADAVQGLDFNVNVGTSATIDTSTHIKNGNLTTGIPNNSPNTTYGPAITNIDITSVPGMLFNTNANAPAFGGFSGANQATAPPVHAGEETTTTQNATNSITGTSGNQQLLARITLSTLGIVATNVPQYFLIRVSNSTGAATPGNLPGAAIPTYGDTDFTAQGVASAFLYTGNSSLAGVAGYSLLTIPAAVPEPSTVILGLLGAAGLGLTALRRRRRSA